MQRLWIFAVFVVLVIILEFRWSVNIVKPMDRVTFTKPHPPSCPCPMPTFEDGVEQQFVHIVSKYPNISRMWRQSGARRFEKERHHLREVARSMSINVQMKGQCNCGGLFYQRLEIREKYIGEVTSGGGSGYMVTSHTQYLTPCPVVDFFNGTYAAYCPLYATCANFSVLLKHLQFAAFKGVSEVLEKPVWNAHGICNRRVHLPARFEDVMDANKNSSSLIKVSKMSIPRHDLTGGLGHWTRQVSKDWSWVRHDGQVFPVQDNRYMCRCLNKFSTVYMHGASHLDFNHKCLRSRCGQDKPFVFSKDRMIAPTMKSMSKLLSKLASQPKRQKPVVFIIQFGSWDLSQIATEDLLYSYIPRFKEFLVTNLLAKNASLSNIRVLVVSSPSVPDIDKGDSRVVSRNNWMSAVFSNVLKRKMEEIGIEYLSAFTFHFPLYLNVWSWPRIIYHDHHYQRALSNGTCVGRVGEAFLELLVSRLCPDSL